MSIRVWHPDPPAESFLSLHAAAFIFNEDGHVLLIKENYGRRRYGPPGGSLDEGESPQQAAVGEVLEETGLIVAVRDLVGIRWAELDGDRFLGFGFRCELLEGTPAIQDPAEIAEVGWFDPRRPPEPTTNLARLLLGPAADGRSGLVLPLSDLGANPATGPVAP